MSEIWELIDNIKVYAWWRLKAQSPTPFFFICDLITIYIKYNLFFLIYFIFIYYYNYFLKFKILNPLTDGYDYACTCGIYGSLISIKNINLLSKHEFDMSHKINIIPIS